MMMWTVSDITAISFCLYHNRTSTYVHNIFKAQSARNVLYNKTKWKRTQMKCEWIVVKFCVVDYMAYTYPVNVSQIYVTVFATVCIPIEMPFITEILLCDSSKKTNNCR